MLALSIVVATVVGVGLVEIPARWTAGPPGVLVGVDSQTGRQRWRAVVGGDGGANVGIGSTAAGVVTVLRQDCNDSEQQQVRGHYALLAFDATDGHSVWSKDNTTTEPLYGLGAHSQVPIILVTTYAGTLEALDAHSGRVQWRQARGPRAVGQATIAVPPVAEGTIGRLLITSNRLPSGATDGTPALEARDLRTGKTIWRHSFESLPKLATDGEQLVAVSSTVEPSTVASASPLTKVHVDFLALADGKTTRALDLDWPGFGIAQVLFTPTTIVIGDNTNAGLIRGYEVTTGMLRWEANGILNFVNGEVIGRSLVLQKSLVALDAQTGTTLWEHQASFGTASGSSIVLSDIDPYTNAGRITAVDARSGTPLWERSRQPLGFGGTTKGISALVDRGCRVADAA